MAYWNGDRWAAEDEQPTHRAGRAGSWAATAVMALGLIALLLPLQGVSAAPRPKADPPCTVSASSVGVGEAYTVSVAGLPTGTPINLWVTDALGTFGSPLGSTVDGTFAMTESSRVAGTTTYTFSGPTKNRTDVYSTCSVNAS